MGDQNKAVGFCAYILTISLTVGFLIGGGIAYGYYDHECKNLNLSPDQICPVDKERFISFVIMCVGGAFTACNCLLGCCVLCLAGCGAIGMSLGGGD
jgi:hypothetical protein